MLEVLRPTIELLDTNDAAIKNQLKNSNAVKGLLK
jgi:hypothetical protein